MKGAGAKEWHAFLSAAKGPDGNPVNAIDRIGEGPWYDRMGRLVAMNKAALLQLEHFNKSNALSWSLTMGLFAGLGGAALSTATLDRFEHNMPAGLGFMAVAAMVFGRWTPLGAAGAAAFFAFGNALRIALSSSAPELLQLVPQGVLLALPYALTLVVLSLQREGRAAPAALGTAYDAELR